MSLPRASPEPAGSPHVADGVPPELLVRALSATSEISLITDSAQRIMHASRSFSAITGYAEAEVLGNNCRILQGPGTAPETARAIRDALSRGEQFRGDILNYRKDGSPFWNALTVTPLLDEDGQVTHFVSVQRDINARMAMHEQLRFQATHDQLTGLPNRAALDAHLAKVLDPDAGVRPAVAVAVGLIDLDRFKDVNNAVGHSAGDAILAGWAARMQALLQPAEFLARMGGDEFVLVVEYAAGDDTAAALDGVLKRLGRSVEESFAAAGERISLTMSAGLASSPRNGTETRTLLRGAYAALNVAKTRAGGPESWWELAADTADARVAPGTLPGTRVPGSMPVQPGAGSGPVNLLKERLFGGGLEMFMQPAVDLGAGSVYLFEALARLRLVDGSVLPPAAFLQYLSEAETDRLFRLGLDQALACLPAWDGEGLSAKVSVNIAPSTLLDPDCPTFVEESLQRHGIAPQRLVLELLETGTTDWDAVHAPLSRLVQLGVGLAMDDLGAGYSSLKRLSMLPFTAVKIDRDMLTGLHTSPLESLSLIATLVQIGRDFGMTVVAEGLEDLGMTEAVAVMGAGYGQGYHLARPMPASEVPEWTAEFESREYPHQVRTALGALAYHWKFLRLGSPHPHKIEDCPFTGYLAARGGCPDDVERWHAQQHRADSSSGASRMIVDWLVREIRRGG